MSTLPYEKNLKEKQADPVIAYVRQHCAQIRSCEEAARSLGVTAKVVAQRISRTGLSLEELVLQYQLDWACELLELTQMDIEQIARKVGLGTPKRFSGFFEEGFQMKPQEYRAACRMGEGVT